jgi:hypothetical protein
MVSLALYYNLHSSSPHRWLVFKIPLAGQKHRQAGFFYASKQKTVVFLKNPIVFLKKTPPQNKKKSTLYANIIIIIMKDSE